MINPACLIPLFFNFFPTLTDTIEATLWVLSAIIVKHNANSPFKKVIWYSITLLWIFDSMVKIEIGL